MKQLINNLTNICVYIIYIFIALISIILSYKVSIIISLMVIPIELIRLIAIYKKMHKFIGAVIILNLALISYSSYTLYTLDKNNNELQVQKNQIRTSYTNKTWLTVNKLNETLDKAKPITQVNLDYRLIIAMYAAFEILMLLFIKELNKQAIRETKKPIKPVKQIIKPTKEVKSLVPNTNAEEQAKEEDWQYVGSYINYAKINGTSVRKTKELFKQAEQEGRFKKIDGKNYINTNIKV